MVVEWTAVGTAPWGELSEAGHQVHQYDAGVWEEPAGGAAQDHKQPQQATDVRTGPATLQDRSHQELELMEHM